MMLSIASFKGGVGKSTLAIHLACYVQQRLGKVMLLDSDPNRSCLAWQARGRQAKEPLPFIVADAANTTPDRIKQYGNYVCDTKARLELEELSSLAKISDLVLVPTIPDALSLDALLLNVRAMEQLGIQNYKIVLNIVPPRPNLDGERALEFLRSQNLPVCSHSIRRFTAVSRSAAEGIPVYAMKGDANAKIAWRDYVAVGEEILP